ncbi:MAG: hypothetical protein GXX99_01565 [Clostridiales bacterium]|nr:hypothetical protein [Clostridiales bacterium]
MNFRLPAARAVERTVYGSFKGVDFSTDSTRIDPSRSPWAPNLISDSGGHPQKRTGWRRLTQVEAPCNGIFYASFRERDCRLIHGGTKLYAWDTGPTPRLIYEGVNSAPSFAFVSGDLLYLLTGREYLCYDGEQVRPVGEVAYVPTVTLSRAPAGGGTVYESINLLCDRRRDSFLADGSSRTYQLSAAGIDAVTEVLRDGEPVDVASLTVDLEKGTVTFQTAPQAPTVAGQDNLQITYRRRVEDYERRIAGCRFGMSYGAGDADYWFLSGNPEHQSTDWHSALKDPTYFPDLGYAEIGAPGTAITGYAPVGDSLAILKQENAQDATIFLRRAELMGSEVVFPVRQGVAGVGALSHRSVSSILDEPLFLSRTGVYAIAGSAISDERTVQNRSHFADPQLCREPGLERAVAVNWEGRCMICVNGRAYLLDGTQRKAWRSGSENDYVYECYHWDNIPAVCFLELDGELFFGTADGWVCRFNSDVEGVGQYHDDGQPIVCEWRTREDDDGDFMQHKSLLRRGCGVQVRPYARGSVTVLLATDGERDIPALRTIIDRFDWQRVDFGRFSFDLGAGAQLLPFRTACRNYLTLQIVVRNGELYEGLGVLGIVKRFCRGRSKR